MNTLFKVVLGILGVGVVYSIGRSRGSYLEQIAHGASPGTRNSGFLSSGEWPWLP